MESIHTDLALYGSKNESARTDNEKVFSQYLRSAIVRFPLVYLASSDISVQHMELKMFSVFHKLVR